MRLCVLSLALAATFVTGCSSDNISLPSVREKFSPTYHTHIVKADQRKTYDAAKAALKPMDFQFVRGGPAQGKLYALNSISKSDDLRVSRQMSLDVKLSTVPEGTEVAALFSEMVEDDYDRHPGMPNTNPLRQTGIYDVYFQHIDEALAAAAK